MKRLSVIIIALFLLCMSLCVYANYTGEALAKNVVRLHVIANSDSAEDQAVKQTVRDALLAIGCSKETVSENLAQYRETALRVLRENGFSEDVRVEYGQFPFPTKEYDALRLPAGYYDAVRVVIGEGAGQNWWCVLFPPLCYTQGATVDAQAMDTLRGSLSGDDYALVSKDGGLPVEIRFKIVEWFGSRMEKETAIYAKTD